MIESRANNAVEKNVLANARPGDLFLTRNNHCACYLGPGNNPNIMVLGMPDFGGRYQWNNDGEFGGGHEWDIVGATTCFRFFSDLRRENSGGDGCRLCR